MKKYIVQCNKCGYNEKEKPILYQGFRDFIGLQRIKKALSEMDCPNKCGKTIELSDNFIDKEFECKPRCEFPKLAGVVFDCDKCIKKMMQSLTPKQIEKILVVMNDKDFLTKD